MGYIKIWREIQETKIWDTDEPFDRRSAWIDLLLMANYRDNNISKVKRGQIPVSLRALAERWNWGKDKTLKYLRELESEGMIVRKSGGHGTLLTIVKYDDYQLPADTQPPTKQTPNRQPNRRPSATLEESKEGEESILSDSYESDARTYVRGIKNAVDAWNAIPWTENVIRMDPSSKRYKNIKARIKEYGEEAVVECISRAGKSAFLRNSNWFNFEWLVKPNNFVKVIENRYERDFEGKSRNADGVEEDDLRRGFDEMQQKWLHIKEQWGGETGEAGHIFWDICTGGAEMTASGVDDYTPVLLRADMFIGALETSEKGGDLGAWLINESLRLGLKKQS